ncbi:MAG: S8 family serine peptidase [Lachnospiraceae bacterium]|nr:S8 family serine peptidase [Lachnospiraceae bacterium]
MENQKLENLLNLALEISENERERSGQLGVGFDERNRSWELIVKYHGDISRLQSGVISVEELIAGYAIVTIPESLIETFTLLDEVEYVEKPKRLYASTLFGKQASCILPVTIREPFLTGSGTLIAVIDSGIDFQSVEFRNRTGSTRIRYLWDQTLAPERVNAQLPEGYEEFAGQAAPPEGFQTGVEFAEDRINAAINSPVPERIVPSVDTSGHGTAVASIAAGSGFLSEGQYQGVAPESELLIVKMGTPAPDSFPKTTELMRAVTYAVKKAVELERPLAVNLSFGNTYGSHDGTSLVERFLDNAAEIGRTVICVGSGNEGAAGGHSAGSFGRVESPSTAQRIELSVDRYQLAFGVQLWKDYSDQFDIEVISPGGESLRFSDRQTGGASYRIEDTQILLYVGEPSPYSVKQEIYFDLLPAVNYVNQGIWTFLLTPIRTVTGGYDFYLPSSNVLNAGTRFITPTPEKTLTIPSTASKVITVGAYNAQLEAYADFSGRGYPVQGAFTERILTREIKPDLAAPGTGIYAVGPNNSFVQVSGTSFATPFVTGSAALMMEWGIVRGNDIFLYGAKVKAYLRSGAKTLRGEREVPNDKTGYGALCVENSIPL